MAHGDTGEFGFCHSRGRNVINMERKKRVLAMGPQQSCEEPCNKERRRLLSWRVMG